ncbi:MAG: glycosyltransferase family 4 protein [Actinomycetota bacterium]
MVVQEDPVQPPRPGRAIAASTAPEATPGPSRRIAMVVMSRYPADPRVRREAEALERAGHAVEVFCLRGPDEPARSVYGSVTAHRIMRERDKESVVQYLATSVAFTAASTARLLGKSVRTRYDAVQAHTMPDYLAFAGIVHRVLRRPLVLDLHDLSVELLGSKWSGRKAKLLTPIVKLGERVSCGLSTHLISTSPGFTDRLVSRGNDRDKITLVLNTANPDLFYDDGTRTFSPIERDARLVYHGTITERFGLAVAIEALVELRRHVPGSTFEIYGEAEPTELARLQGLVEELDLHDAVTFGGWRSFEELGPIIRSADIGVVPYLHDEFMDLALSTKTFEYAASGLPVVASRLKPVESVFGEEPIQYFEPGDARDLADQLIRACGDTDGRRRRAELAAAAVESISGEVMARRYVDLIEGAIGR